MNRDARPPQSRRRRLRHIVAGALLGAGLVVLVQGLAGGVA